MTPLPTAAHFGLHFAFGATAVTLLLLPRVIAAIRSDAPCHPTVLRWIVGALLAGLFAAVPNLLAFLGVPAALTQGWWMNLFFLHPLLDRFKHGGILIGELLCLACFCLQYAVVLSAIVARRRTAMR